MLIIVALPSLQRGREHRQIYNWRKWVVVIGVCNNEEILMSRCLEWGAMWDKKVLGGSFVSARYHAANVIWNAII